MSDKRIHVTIPQFGAPVVEAVGFNGEGCTDATSAIERALTTAGSASVEFKPEWQNPAGVQEEDTEQMTW